MINLLSNDVKNELRAARRNVIIRRYVVTLVFSVIAVTGAYAIGFFMLSAQEESFKQELARYEPQKAKYKDTIAKASEYTANLKIAKTILENEIFFSDYLLLLAKTIPSNSVLVNLNTKSSELSKPVTLTYNTKSYNDSLRIKEALEQSAFFNDVKIKSVDHSPLRDYDYRSVFEVSFDKGAYIKASREGTL